MDARIGVLAPLALFAAAGPTPAPSKTKYVIETTIEQTVDLTAMGQGEQKTSVTQVVVLTVTLTDSAGGKALHAVVDSMAVTGPMAPAPSQLQGLKGTYVHGYLDSHGRPHGFLPSSDSSEMLGQLSASLHTFYPRLKPGVRQGDTWLDTTEVASKTSSQQTKTRVITTYTAGAEESVGAAKARRIEASHSAAASGKIQNPMAGEMEMESNESGSGTYFVTSDGRFLGGSMKATGSAKVSSAMLPEPIPIRISRTTKVSVVE